MSNLSAEFPNKQEDLEDLSLTNELALVAENRDDRFERATELLGKTISAVLEVKHSERGKDVNHPGMSSIMVDNKVRIYCTDGTVVEL